MAIGGNRALGPLLNRLGYDTKGAYEYAYWKSRHLEEQTLQNSFYKSIFTKGVDLPPSFYTGKRILDVGCGPRGSLEWCGDAKERVGLDTLAERYRKLGTDDHAMTYVPAGAEVIPFDDNHFDIVTSINSLDHVVNVEAAVTEMHRVLCPGGSLIVMVDIHERPTVAEPHCIPWDLSDQLRDRFDIVMEEHREKSASGSRTGTPAFDHSDPTKRYGVLVLRGVKR